MRSDFGMKVITNDRRARISLSLTFGLIWTSAAMGAAPLFPGAQYAADDIPHSVAIGDLNGDRVSDLAVANGLSGRIRDGHDA